MSASATLNSTRSWSLWVKFLRYVPFGAHPLCWGLQRANTQAGFLTVKLFLIPTSDHDTSTLRTLDRRADGRCRSNTAICVAWRVKNYTTLAFPRFVRCFRTRGVRIITFNSMPSRALSSTNVAILATADLPADLPPR